MKITKEAFLTSVYQGTHPRGVLTSVHDSDIAVDIVIPATSKDANTLSYCIQGVRKYLRHPIGDVFVIAPHDQKIVDLAEAENAIFVDETSLGLPTKEEIQFFCAKTGADRNGWILQQFIKLSGDKIANLDHYYVIDSDTVLTRPQSFQHFDKLVFLLNEYFTVQYMQANQRISGIGVQLRYGFVAHQMLFRNAWLAELKAAIEERHQKPWTKAVIDGLERRKGNGFCEYELYGNWCYANYRDQIQCIHWENGEVKPSLIAETNLDDPNYRSLSFHSYLEDR